MKRKSPFLIGLTGSIGMGKSTTAQMFRDEGIPVWDADEAVHRLYTKGGAAVAPMSDVLPTAIVDDAVNREKLKELILKNINTLKTIENIVHPLVAADRAAFVRDTKSDIVVLDIPLLFETGGEEHMDLVAVVSAPASVQRDRVLARPGMTEAIFEQINSKQLPDAEKRKRADVIIPTETLEGARLAVQNVIRDTREKLANA